MLVKWLLLCMYIFEFKKHFRYCDMVLHLHFSCVFQFLKPFNLLFPTLWNDKGFF